MGDGETCPLLISRKKLKSEFSDLQKIQITCDTFSLGRGLNNSLVIPYIAISRNHCLFKKDAHNSWTMEDNSSFGIKINGNLLGKGSSKILSDGDVLTLEQTEEFVYEFKNQVEDVFEIPRKRIKLEEGNIDDNSIINNMKIKFEESQSHEIEHIEQKLKNVKHMQTTSMIITRQLHKEMTSRVKQLEADFTLQIENLKGEKNEIERQKAILLEERDAQLAGIKCEMEEKIGALMKQVQKHNEAEIELMKENSSLKKKLEKEREEFLAELSRENSSKKDMLEKLEAKIKEQEEVRAKERQDASELLHREIEKLKNIKEQQIKEIEEQKRQREAELKKELADIKDNLEEKVLQTEQEKLKAEQLLNEQLEKMKKLSDEEKIKIDELTKEREEIQQRLQEAQTTAARSIQELTARVTERETELAALAAERIQKQAEQSGEVISILQEQLEKVKNQLLMVETEKNTMLENYCAPDNGEGSSKETLLNEVGEILESELQCSICAELFVAATILNCSHTFCKYCITMWKKKKKDCPICRAPIQSECKSLVLDTFIEKMVQNLSEEMKEKRKNILKDREELESMLAQQTNARTSRDASFHSPLKNPESTFKGQNLGSVDQDSGRNSFNGSDSEYFSDENEEGEEEQEYEDSDEEYYRFRRQSRYYSYSDDSDGGSDAFSHSGSDATSQPDESAGTTSAEPGASSAATDSRTRRREFIEGIPGSYYGGYGRCYRCGARGHWAPGCPLTIT